MFRRNQSHQQNELFSSQTLLGEDKVQKLKDSEEAVFYELIYRAIPEEEFAVLYSDAKSRPNAPVNTLVAALILKHRRAWSYQELFDHIDFDLKTRLALGLRELSETPFVESTIFNFQNRLAAHQARTGENLLERVFDRLTRAQLEALELKASIQRADSFLAASNIRDYSRLQLIIEVLQRFVRVLSEADRDALGEHISAYCARTSGKQIYRLPAADVPGKLAELGEIYRQLLADYEVDYGSTEAYRILRRVFGEHFTPAGEQPELRPPERRKTLRANVEATVKEMKGAMKAGKLPCARRVRHPMPRTTTGHRG